MKCGRCGLSWDTNDPDPPACGRKIDRRAIPERRVTRAVERIEQVTNYATGGPVPETERLIGEGFEIVPPTSAAAFRQLVESMPGADRVPAMIPAELPDDLAEQMAREYMHARLRHATPADAMRAAYKVFLDRLGQD